MRGRLIVLLFLACSTANAAVTRAELLAQLKQTRERLRAESDVDKRAKLFGEFQKRLSADAQAAKLEDDRELFFTLTRLDTYMGLIESQKTNDEFCARSRAQIFFFAHPKEEPPESHIPDEAKEALSFLDLLCPKRS